MDSINDMTEGKVSQKILGFFFPMLWTNLLQQLYSVADTAIVGKGIGDNALAAVGIIAAVSLLIIGFSMGLTNGFSVIIAQSYGSADHSRVRKTVWQSARLCVIIAAILTVFSMIFLKQILQIMQTDSIIMNDTLSYGRIIFGGLAVTVAYNLCSGILRALGDSKTPFKAIIISSTVNILLDILMIFVLKTSVAGAAIATITAQLVSVIICIFKIKSLTIMKFDKVERVPDKEISLLLLKNGLPMAFMNSLTAVGCMIVQAYINKLGVDYTSAYSVCTKYLNLFMLPSLTAGFTVSAFTGQNFGAKKFDRIREGVRAGLLISFISYIILGAVMNIFSLQLAKLMLSGNNAAGFTSDYLRILGFTLIGVNCIFIFRNAVQGMGCPSVPMIS
ncbi:MAG: MATE family efflux transporter [Ruminococcus sp.]|nr:MATE family efflux transporter [Ruminococcus sp.]